MSIWDRIVKHYRATGEVDTDAVLAAAEADRRYPVPEACTCEPIKWPVGVPGDVEWKDVTGLLDREQMVLPGHTYCHTPGCVREGGWF